MTNKQADTIAAAIRYCFISPNVSDSNMEPACVVDVIANLANATWAAANAITPRNAAPGRDATGGTVASLTEAVMGVSYGLVRIADAIRELAEVSCDK